MATFTLRPCYVRDTSIVVDRSKEPLTTDWKGLVALLAPTRTQGALQVLAELRQGAFVGLIVTRGIVGCFLLHNYDATGSIKRQVKSDPTFGDRIQTVYFVEESTFDSRFLETP